LPAYTPHLKGTVERTNETIEQIFLAELPGFTHGGRKKNGHLVDRDAPLLPLEVLVELFAQFVEKFNTKRPHQALTGLTPAERWNTDPTPIQTVSGERLRHLLLASATRVVSKRGIRFAGRTYNCAELCGYVGEQVEVRYMPNHDHAIEVFMRDQHIGTAILVDYLTKSDAKRLLQHRTDEARWLAREQRGAAKRRRIVYAAMTAPGPITPVTALSEEATAAERSRHADGQQQRLASRSLIDHGLIPERMIQPRPASGTSA
jgi:putative transposase